MIGALILGTVLAVGALAFVLYPVFFGVPRTVLRVQTRADHSSEDSAVAALREIEFDRATGKLSESDYEDLKRRYTRQAIDAMRRSDGASTTRPSDEELEAVVRAFREHRTKCPTCGPRPERDAVFCSDCGRCLRDKCAACGALVDALDARYCVNCGTSLAA